MTTEPNDVASAALRQLFHLGRRASRYRLLVVACRNQHRLAAVYETSVGPVLAGKTRTIIIESHTDGGTYLADEDHPVDWEATLTRRRQRSRATPVVVAVTDGMPDVVELQCRCSLARLPAAWLRAQITPGRRRRAVWPPPRGGQRGA